MKLIKTAGQQTTARLVLSKAEWLAIGKTCGWLEILGSVNHWFIEHKELLKCLFSLGWTYKGDLNDHHTLFSPDGKHTVTISAHTYEDFWTDVRRYFLRENPDLRFVFEPDFIVPPNFDRKTQKLLPKQQNANYVSKTIPVPSQLPTNINEWETMLNGTWRRIEEIDWSDNTAMLDDASVVPLPQRNIQIRKRVG